MKEITVTAKLIVDENYLNAPSLADTISVVEFTVTAPDNEAYGIKSVSVVGSERLLSQDEVIESTDSISPLFPLESLYEELKPIALKFSNPSIDDDTGILAVAVIINALMAGLVKINRRGDATTLENLAIVSGMAIAGK